MGNRHSTNEIERNTLSISTLHQAAMFLDVEKLRIFCQNSDITAIIECKDVGFGYTVLHWIVKDNGRDKQTSNKRKQCIQMLVAAGANINAIARDGETVLHMCMRHGYIGEAELLLTLGAQTAIPNNQQCIPLHIAAQYSNIKGLELLLRHIKNNPTSSHLLKLKDSTGATALHSVGTKNQHPTFSSIGYDVDDDDFNLKLYQFIKHTWPQCVQMLVAAGSDINEINHQGGTLLYQAIMRRQSKIIHFLLERGVDTTVLLVSDQTYLMVAADQCASYTDYDPDANIKKSNEIFRTLLNFCNIQATNQQGKTLLQYAATKCNADIIEYLLIEKKGVLFRNLDTKEIPSALNELLRSAMSYNIKCLTRRNCFLRTIEVLLNEGVSPYIQNKNGASLDYLIAEKSPDLYDVDEYRKVYTLFERALTNIEKKLSISHADLLSIIAHYQKKYTPGFWDPMDAAMKKLRNLTNSPKEQYCLIEIREVLQGTKMSSLSHGARNAFEQLAEKLYEFRMARLEAIVLKNNYSLTS